MAFLAYENVILELDLEAVNKLLLLVFGLSSYNVHNVNVLLWLHEPACVSCCDDDKPSNLLG